MNLYSCFRAFWSLLLLVCVSGDITRGDNYFEGEFSNNHKGRMLRVLMAFNNLPLDKCVVKCIQHIRCKTVNYNFAKEKCELTDVDFKDDEADKLSYDWYNIGTPSKVDGAWGLWRNVTRCSATCGGGTMNQARDCDSPKPKHGGDDCDGKGERTVDCNTHQCPAVDGNWGSWMNSTACTVTCGGGTLTQIQLCDSPKPQHGSKDCNGLRERTIFCNTHLCPLHGSWGAWKVISVCNYHCDKGNFTKARKCNYPAPEHGGNDCLGDKERSLPCTKDKCPVVNIALKKPTTQSGRNTGFKAANGNDGNMKTHSQTSFKSDSWWQVDLTEEVQIEYFILRVFIGYKDKEDVTICVKAANGLSETCSRPILLKNKFAVTIPFDINRKFRYVKIKQKNKGHLIITEFEVYVKKS